jgi:membrane protease subunit HflK
MAWDDGNNKDPWRSRGNQGPADLDAIVRDLQRKLSGLFGGRGRDREPGERGPGAKVGSGLLLFALFVLVGLWGLTGFYIVDEAEEAIVLRFGELTKVEVPGLQWHLPWPIESAVIINTEESLRLEYTGSMLTRDENIVEIELIVQYRRADPEAYLFSLRDPEITIEHVTASAIREIVGKNDLDYILTEGRLDIALTAQNLLQATLDSYATGITVYEVNLQEASFPAEVQPSVQDVVKAREDRARLIFESETYRNALLPDARGEAARQLQDAEAYRARITAIADGESNRFLQILREYEQAPEVTRERMYLETLQGIYANSTKIIVDTDEGNNLLYLPLDQLMQRQGEIRDPAAGAAAPGSSLPETPPPVRPSLDTSVRR